jgi:hypothetical protein
MFRCFKPALLNVVILAPLAIAPITLQAQETPRTYHDSAHNDDHQWNAHEDQAYRIWVKQNHRKNEDFAKLKEEDQRAYWAWRHEHSDAVLKINIR